MDSVFNDIEFIMGNVKQERDTSNSNEREGVRNNCPKGPEGPDQLAMSTYMTDFIMDYINRTLKNDEEETQQENNTENTVADREDEEEEESVEELLARAENMIRENTQHCNEMQHIPETSAANADRMQQLNAQVNSLIDHSPADSGQSSNPAPVPNSAGESYAPVPVANEVSDVIITVDTDSDDEVIFINSHKPTTEIPVIDLSDHSSAADTSIQQKRKDSRKRTHDSIEILCDSPIVPAEQPVVVVEKQFRHNCAICLDDVKSPHSTTCGHIYCGYCIKNALKIFKKCPSCNKKLKVSNVHPIYL